MRTKRLIPIIIAVTIVLFLAIIAVLADVTTTFTVLPGQMQDWQTQTSPGAQPTPASTPSVSFVNGPATPPLGSGSAQFSVGSDGGAIAQLRQPDYAGTALPNPSPDPDNPNPAGNELTELKYSTYVQVGGSASQAPYIILDVDYDNNGTVDDHLVFEPQYQIAGFCPSNPQGPVSPGTWQTWDAFNGCWYSTGGAAGSGPGANVKPLITFSAASPNAKIVNSGSNGGVRIVTGGGGVIGGGAASDWSGFVGNVDDFRIGVGFDPDNGPIVTEYDFEAAPPPPPPSADLLVAKTANTSGVTPGETITYTIQVSNLGPNDATNVALNDTLPNPTTFHSLTPPNGWSCSDPGAGNTGTVNCTKSTFTANATAVFTLVVDVPQNATPNPNNPFITNEATATSDTNDPTPDNNIGSASISFGTCLTNGVVTTNADSGAGSLRQAIIDACDGGTISFDMTQVVSPITLTSGELLINKNLTIGGPGANLLTVMRSTAGTTPQFRVFEVASGAITVNISGLIISNGRTGTIGNNGDNGGGILNNTGATLNLSDVTVSGNQTAAGSNASTGGIGGNGGGVFNNGTLTLTNSTISGNQTGAGGSSSAANGSPGGGGGGVFNSGTVTLVNSTVSGNQTGVGGSSASGDGGGGGGGGGVSNSGTLTLINSTISGNQTGAGHGGAGNPGNLGGPGGSGGGVFNAGTLTLVNGTISGNQTGAGGPRGIGGSGGGIRNNSGNTANVHNTIIAGNSVASGGSGPDFSGTLNSQDYNLIGNTSDASFTGTTTHNIINVNALLGPLANNGGPTQTIALLGGSPAIDQGAAANDPSTGQPITTDQRGQPRPVDNPNVIDAAGGNASDIGAYEAAAPPVVSTPSVSPTTASEGSSTSFTVSGTFTDAAATLEQPFTAVVNWGDTTTSTATVSGSDNPFGYSFSGNHTYAQSGLYNVTVSVTDTHGTTGTSAATVVTVSNVEPTVGTPTVSPTTSNEGSSTSFSVSGTFMDPAGALDAPFTAVVNWGDSTTSTATVSGSANPFGYSFSGNHTYAQSGSYNVTVSVTDKDGSTGTSAAQSVTVANVAPTVGKPTVSPISANEGSNTAFSVSGTFTDPAGALDAPFTAVVNWGDSTTSTATVSGSANPFGYSFSGNHTYAQSGSYNVTVSVTDKDGSTGTSAAQSVTVANVAPTVSTPTVAPTSANEGSSTAFSVSGTFTDPAGALDAPFTAVVNWGDSTTSTATVSGSGNPFNYSFSGNHTYAQSGSFNVTVSVTDKDGGTGNSAPTAVAVANVAPAVGTPTVSPTTSSEGSSTAFSVSGTFTDPAGALDAPFTAVVNWGDSTTSTATVSGSGNPFNYSFSGNHTYAQNGSYNVTVSVTDKDGGTGTSAARVVTVSNVPPTVGTPVVSPTNSMAGVTAAFSVSGTFTDPAGALDQPFTAVVNWGDGTTNTATVSGSSNPFSYSFSGNHTYAAVGSFNVTVSVTDKDGGTGTSAATAVTVAAPTMVYAEPSGNCGAGNMPCFSSIQAAINAVATGGTVNVIGGVFNESVNLNKSATVNINGNTTINDFTISAGTLNGSNGGSFTLTLATGNWNNNGGTFNPGAGTVSFTGNGQTIGGSNPTTFNGLTLGANGTILNGAQEVDGSSNITPAAAPVDTTVAGLLTLNGDLTTTGAAKVIMLATATSTGPGDVVGNVQRLGFVSGGAALSLGNALNTIQINSGTAPTDITINLVKAAPTGFTGAVKRTYTITPNPASGIFFSATLQLRYLTTELNGNTEALLRFWKFLPARGWQQQDFPAGLNTTHDLVNHTLKLSGVPGFSLWTLANVGPTVANSTVSGRIVDDSGKPVEGAVVRMSGTQTRKTITDANGNYQFNDVETNGFYTVTPSRANYTFTPANRSFSQLGNQTAAAFDASFSGDKANPLDTAEYFVRQQYVDVLGREPDEGGFNYWSDQILACNDDAACIQSRRVGVAAAFFIEQEFQQTGSFIYDVYSGALGRRPAFAEYNFDRQQVIGGETLDAEKAAFTQSFVQRPEFTQKYSNAMTAQSFVDAVLQTVQHSSGLDLSGERGALIARYQSGGDMNQSRGFVLSDVAANAAFNQAQYNSAFVLTEYFGYLRRDPDQGGYDFWLNVVNDRSPNNYRGMVCAFVTSAEYQRRFTAVVTRTNSECGP
jgi:Domain of unknown function DUF11/Carboxypeptidase regulatory-like domain